MSLAMLLLVACSGGQDVVGVSAGDDAVAGNGASSDDAVSDDDDGPASGDSIVEQLRSNAAQFEYTVGEHGGTFTFATISEPLTFNLAISTDASSSGVLGYLFEGLTETSWLTDRVEPALVLCPRTLVGVRVHPLGGGF